MCAILGWSGLLPKGLLSKLLVQCETRGKDSVGLAYRAEARSLCYRHAVPAREFVVSSEKLVGEARRSLRGIAHARRASPGMPVDNANAHPFSFWKYLFAHNGRIENWGELKTALVQRYQGAYDDLAGPAMESTGLDRQRLDATMAHAVNPVDKAKRTAALEADAVALKAAPGYSDLFAAAYCTDYARRITTDSMVLGPYIDTRDLSAVVGCMGLVWMRGPVVYTFRHGKEATAATVVWKYLKSEADAGDQLVTLVASTREIVTLALEALDKTAIEWSVKFFDFPENEVFRVEPDGLVSEGLIPVNQKVVRDEWSSAQGDAVAAAAVTAAGEVSGL